MEIKKNGKLSVYYYNNLIELKENESLFKNLQIRLDNIGEYSPIKICPRSEEYHILLWNSGDKNKDLEKLNISLSKLGIENFNGKL